MTEETIVAIYDTPTHAARAAQDLEQAGVPESAISVHAGDANAVAGNRSGAPVSGTPVSGIAVSGTAPKREPGFWSRLFGGEPDHDAAFYDRSVESGSTIVTVKTPVEHVDQVTAILDRYDPIDIDERAASYGLSQTTTTTAQAPLPGASVDQTEPSVTARDVAAQGVAATEPNTIQLSEEQLVVGKRLVNRGSTRIRRFVVETPVEQQVTLRDETVTLERHPVTDRRPVDNVDFTDKTIELTETFEEAVIDKRAYVTEEVVLRKQASERTETVRDTVRREDVEIEKIPGGSVTGGKATGEKVSGETLSPTNIDGPAPRMPKV